MHSLESEKQFSNWLLDVGIANEGDVVNLPEIYYPEVQDPIAQLYNAIDFQNVTSKQLKDRAILAVTNDIFLEMSEFEHGCGLGNQGHQGREDNSLRRLSGEILQVSIRNAKR
ncbi:hypothetical protein JTE90_022815 [Oedothorax gibbosus]|uniref:ATP-dependent DNA helicase n=1 Tax=Oedothorax gibbosus TaxID=931172 RepID=A0AAV6V7X7_9ARAC|nr:hypothetical protein JTE90_022815 [Oedothorax gibbosus]